MFTAIVLALVALLMAARARLVATEGVTIIINDDEANPMIVPHLCWRWLSPRSRGSSASRSRHCF